MFPSWPDHAGGTGRCTRGASSSWKSCSTTRFSTLETQPLQTFFPFHVSQTLRAFVRVALLCLRSLLQRRGESCHLERRRRGNPPAFPPPEQRAYENISVLAPRVCRGWAWLHRINTGLGAIAAATTSCLINLVALHIAHTFRVCIIVYDPLLVNTPCSWCLHWRVQIVMFEQGFLLLFKIGGKLVQNHFNYN